MRKLAYAVTLIAGSAPAQFAAPIPHPDWAWQASAGRQSFDRIIGQNLFNQTLKRSVSKGRDSNSLLEQPAPNGVAQAAVLDFTPSLQRRRANYASFVERSRKVDPAGADGLAETLRMDPVAMMAPELAKFGLRTDNVADAYAVYWVEAWQAVHGVTGASSRATAQAVREQAARAIGGTPEFMNATPAQKQELAETYLVQALLVGAAKEQAGGDRAKLRQVSAAVEKGARASGFDLRAVTLTEEGFHPAG